MTVPDELGTGGEFRQDPQGVLLGIAATATWAAYSVAITPLMRLSPPGRISAVVLPAAWLPSTLIASPPLGSQDWFHSLDRIGPARATLATNLLPLLAALFAVALLSESLSLVQVAGGALIAGGILGARRRASSVVSETPLVS